MSEVIDSGDSEAKCNENQREFAARLRDLAGDVEDGKIVAFAVVSLDVAGAMTADLGGPLGEPTYGQQQRLYAGLAGLAHRVLLETVAMEGGIEYLSDDVKGK